MNIFHTDVVSRCWQKDTLLWVQWNKVSWLYNRAW